MKILGLDGATGCGSTVISLLLGSLPGVIAPGEVHWLLDHACLPTEPYPVQHLCRHCGPNCPVLPRQLLHSASPGNAYNLLAMSYGGAPRLLVSSDKSMGQYVRYKKLPDFILLLTRDPATHVASLARSYHTEANALHAWKAFHSLEPRQVRLSGIPFARLSIEAFLRDPAAGVRWLHSVTNGLVPLGQPVYPATPHHIWGNTTAIASRAIDSERPSKRALSELTREAIYAAVQEEMQEVENLPCPHWNGSGASWSLSNQPSLDEPRTASEGGCLNSGTAETL